MRNVSIIKNTGKALLAATFLMSAIVCAKNLRYQDWSGQCDGKKVCFVQMGNKGPRLLLGWNQADQAVRLGALLPPDIGTRQAVTLWVDDNISVFLTTNSCTKTYCEAMVDAGKTQAVIDTLKKAGTGVLVYPEGGHLQVSPVSLQGFSKAHAAVVAGVGQ